MIRYRLRTLLIVLLLAPPLIALYIAAGLAARNVARDETQLRNERGMLQAERAAFEKERATQRAAQPPAHAPADDEKPIATDNRP